MLTSRYLRVFVLSLVLVCLPVRQAQALIPLAFGVGIVTGVETGLGSWLAGSALVHGVAILGFAWWNKDQSPPSGEQAPLQARLNPQAPKPTPQGWNKDAAGNPVPPSSASRPLGWSHVGMINDPGPGLATAEEGCSSYPGWSFDSYTNPEHTYARCVNGSTYLQIAKNVPMDSCPSGYTLSGSSCTLSDASAVPKPAGDGKTIDPSGAEDAQDPEPLPSNVTNTASNTHIDNGNQQIDLTRNPDGSSTLVDTTYDPDTDSFSRLTVNTSAPGSNGMVIVDSVIQDSGAGNPSGGGTTPSTDPGTSTTPGTVRIDESGTPGAGGSYSGAEGKLGEYGTDRTGQLNSHGPGGSGHVGELPFVWSPDLPQGACGTFEFGYGQWMTTWDFCHWLGIVREGVGYVWIFLTGLYAWNGIKRAQGVSGDA